MKMYNVKLYLACLQLLQEYVTHFHLTALFVTYGEQYVSK